MFERSSGRRRPAGFTLVEVALVLVVIALLVGGILKGWQLIQASRVRTMAETSTAIQSAYFAFHDRFGRVAGDWNAVDAGNAIGATLNGGGNDSGRLDTTPGNPWVESNAFWEHLAKAGFIHGSFQGTAGEPTLENNRTPLNVFQRPIIIGRTTDFVGATSTRRHVMVGRGAPVGMLREVDNKLDDGRPHRGRVRATVDDAGVSVFGGANFWGGSDAACVDAVPAWNVNAESEDCNALLLF
jgi:prepilin-type N-terminal cleavage/methylation domain-containing protein